MSVELSNAEDFITWLKTKLELNKTATTAPIRKVKRGEVYWCHFGINIGSEMSKTTRRPAIIVQDYHGGQNSTNTIVVPATHGSLNAAYSVPLTSLLDSNGSVDLNSRAVVSGVVCISKVRLSDKICKLSNDDMKKIDKNLALTTGLMATYRKLEDKHNKLKERYDKLEKERNEVKKELEKLKKSKQNIVDK